MLAGAIVNNNTTNKTTLIKSGSGLWTLGGANTYSGTTSINAGTLLLQNASIAAGGNVTVATSATFGGSGTVAPNSTVNGNLALTPGTLTFSGTLAFGASARVKWNLTENSASTGFGQINAPAANVGTGAVVDVVLNPAGGTADFANAFWSTPRSWPVLSALSRSGSFTLGTISADSASHPASGYGSFAIQQTATGLNLTWTPLSPIEQWRFTHFGITTNSGIAADLTDPDHDGHANLLEFATGISPISPDGVITNLTISANILDFTYRRSHAAVADGVEFVVEWSNSLSNGWSASDVAQSSVPDSDNGVSTLWKASLPPGTDRRFIRLKTTIHTP